MGGWVCVRVCVCMYLEQAKAGGPEEVQAKGCALCVLKDHTFTHTIHEQWADGGANF